MHVASGLEICRVNRNLQVLKCLARIAPSSVKEKGQGNVVGGSRLEENLQLKSKMANVPPSGHKRLI